MAVTVVDTPTVGEAVVASSITFSYTTGATATGLFVSAANGSAVKATSTVKFNGTDLTELWDLNDSQPFCAVSGYLMVNPAITTANIVVTWAAAVDAGIAGAMSLAGIETSSVAAAHRTVYTATDAAHAVADPTITVVDSENGDLVIDAAATWNATIAVGAGQTSRTEQDNIAGNNISWGASTESATGASTVMSWNSGASTYWCQGATALVASVPPPPPVIYRRMAPTQRM